MREQAGGSWLQAPRAGDSALKLQGDCLLRKVFPLSLCSQWLMAWKAVRLTWLPFHSLLQHKPPSWDSEKTKHNPHLHRSCVYRRTVEGVWPSSATELAPVRAWLAARAAIPNPLPPPSCPELGRGRWVWRTSRCSHFPGPHHPLPSPPQHTGGTHIHRGTHIHTCVHTHTHAHTHTHRRCKTLELPEAKQTGISSP